MRRFLSSTLLSSTFLALFALLPALASAHGLQDLKTALARQQGQTALKAMLEAKTWRRLGEGSDATERHGNASVQLEDVGNGLQVSYSKDLLNKIEAEERARAKDPNSKTPSISATREFEASQLREMTQAANALSRNIEKYSFKSEKPDTFNGKPARLLTFDVPIETLSERERKYIKKFEGSLQVWIAADGTPLASKTTINGYGRVFLVISFEYKAEEQTTYALVGDRLLIVQKESRNMAAGAGERSEEKVVKTMQML